MLVPKDNRILTIRAGVVEGPLMGGNLSLLQCLVGTPHWPGLDGAILFLEDVGEDLYGSTACSRTCGRRAYWPGSPGWPSADSPSCSAT